jgi:hypothetical protein
MLHLSLEDKLTINNDTIKNVLTKIHKKKTNNNKIDDTLNKKGHCF